MAVSQAVMKGLMYNIFYAIGQFHEAALESGLSVEFKSQGKGKSIRQNDSRKHFLAGICS